MEFLGRRDYSLSRILKKLILIISTNPVIPGGVRSKLLRLIGLQIGNSYIGADVLFDGIHPELIKIGNDVTITSGTKILTHFYDSSTGSYRIGSVNIGDGVFIGMNTLIINSVNIGNNAVIGAGSIVICDIPANEIWAGNPARYIKKRNIL